MRAAVHNFHVPQNFLAEIHHGLWLSALANTCGWDDCIDTPSRLDRALTRAMAEAELQSGDEAALLEGCVGVVTERADAIVGEGHRRDYEDAATVAAALAEVLRGRGDSRRGEHLLDGLAERHVRKRAFQRDCRNAAT